MQQGVFKAEVVRHTDTHKRTNGSKVAQHTHTHTHNSHEERVIATPIDGLVGFHLRGQDGLWHDRCIDLIHRFEHPPSVEVIGRRTQLLQEKREGVWVTKERSAYYTADECERSRCLKGLTHGTTADIKYIS